jgi:hypothetical protein
MAPGQAADVIDATPDRLASTYDQAARLTPEVPPAIVTACRSRTERLGGEVLTINGTSVMVWPALNSSVWAIVLAGSPAAWPFSGQVSPVRAMPPLIVPAEGLAGGVVTCGP